MYSYFQKEVNLAYPISIKKVWFFLKYSQVPRFWVPLEQIFRIPYLPPSLVCLLKMNNSCVKKKGEESLFSWLLLSDVFKVFRYSFSEAMPIFFNTSRMLFSFSDRYKIFISDWLWIEVCQNTYSQLKAYCQPWCIARREHKAIRSKKIVIRSSGSG